MNLAIPPLWNSDEAARATRGRVGTPWTASGVSIDSRRLCPGDLFVALAGPTFDAHAFVANAFDKGAAAAVVSRLPERVAADAPLLVVNDTLQALIDLGVAARGRSQARVIGVTGSVGKTSVKEALNLVLSAQADTVASEGNLNNHWGLPLSLARVPRDAKFAIVEMGMNHAGEIAPLSRMAAPDVAVVTTVEAVHKAFFTSVEAIADAKAEIFCGMRSAGIAILNRDNPHFARLAGAARAAGVDRVMTFGRHADADVRFVSVEAGSKGSRVQAAWESRTLDYHLSIPGNHWIMNSLCVLATVAATGADVPCAAAMLQRFAPPKGRGRSHLIRMAGGVLHLIDDSYNASPVSMAAAIEVLGHATPGCGGRRIAVFGDMLELGQDSAALHAGLAEPLRRHDIDLVFTAGPLMAHLFSALPAAMQGGHAPDSAALAPAVAAAVRPGDVVTVKGSAGSRMSVVVHALMALEAAAVAAGER